MMESNASDENLPLSGSTSSPSEDSGRGCRNKKRQLDPTFCPVCGITLRSQEVESHLSTEIEKLSKLSAGKTKLNGKNLSPNGSTEEDGTDKCWETYQTVKSNRQNRQRVKSKKRRADEVTCPICNTETSEDINLHVEKCLRWTGNSEDDSDENIDVESFEEYEWAGQSRVRATSLFRGGLSALGTQVVATEDDEDLVVDGDDTQTYGSPQYSERDVIIMPSGGEDNPEQTALRNALLGAETQQMDTKTNLMEVEEVKSDGDPIVEVLKKKICELESREQNRDVYKCLICLERYRTPVISICCWHVHCEQCWLQTLGAKKLCPQCNMITSPADLRRIYM